MKVPVLVAIEELRRDTGDVSYFFRRVIKELRPLNLQDAVHYPDADNRKGTACVLTKQARLPTRHLPVFQGWVVVCASFPLSALWGPPITMGSLLGVNATRENVASLASD